MAILKLVLFTALQLPVQLAIFFLMIFKFENLTKKQEKEKSTND